MGFKGSFFQSFTHSWFPGWWDVLLCLRIWVFYQLSIHVFERLGVLILVAAYVSPSSPALWCTPLSWLERVVVHTEFQMVKTLSLPGLNTSPLRGPQVTCLPKINWSLGIVLLGFAWGFSLCVSLSLSSRDSRKYVIPTRFSKPLPTVVLPQLQMPVHSLTLSSEAFHIWRQCLSGALVSSLTFSVQVVKASTQPENMQIEAKRYLNPWLGVISVTSSVISSKVDSPQFCLPTSLLGPWQALFRIQFTHQWETEDQNVGRQSMR